MKKIIFSFLIIIITGLSAHACDICGCGVGSYYIGLLPEFNKRFVGLRYQHKTLVSHLGPNGERTPLTADETYQTAELWGGWNIGQRFRVLAFVPFNFNDRKSQDGNGSMKGIGDIALMGYYRLLDHQATVGGKLLVQSLWVGAGIKVPTGKYEPAERLAVQESPNNFQLGTASTDFTINATYDIRLMDFGIDANLNYKINTANKYGYQYGNKFTSNVLAYYKFSIKDGFTVAPNAGILYETSQKDVEDKKYDVSVSGGHSLAMVTGLEATMKRLSFGINFQHQLDQNLAGGRALAGNRLMVHTSIAF